MPPPRYPSRVDPVSFPVFGIHWWGNPGDGSNVIAFCGGGGSAKTGVNNNLVVQQNEDLPVQTSTGDAVGVSLQISQNPRTGKLWIYLALGKEIRRYRWPGAQLDGAVKVGEDVNCVGVNIMGDHFAVGCDSGLVKVYQTSDEQFATACVAELHGHTKTVCSVAFSSRGNRLITSAKDGQARIYSNYDLVQVLECSVQDPSAPPPKKTPQILVRGCAFADLDGKVALTVASPRRGKAYLARWQLQGNQQYQCAERTECSPCPISSMSLSQDGDLLVLGSADGSVYIWSVNDWKCLRKFINVHELPVTCIASRPFPVPLQGDEAGIQYHARSCSADSQLGLLTLQRKGPHKPSNSGDGPGIMDKLYFMVVLFVLAAILQPVFEEAVIKCEPVYLHAGIKAVPECLLHDVLIAPASRPGILVPPH